MYLSFSGFCRILDEKGVLAAPGITQLTLMPSLALQGAGSRGKGGRVVAGRHAQFLPARQLQ